MASPGPGLSARSLPGLPWAPRWLPSPGHPTQGGRRRSPREGASTRLRQEAPLCEGQGAVTLNSRSMRQATRPPRTWEGILRSRSLTPAFLRQGPRLQPPQSLPHGQGATRQSAGGSGRGPAARVGLQACSRPSRSVAPQQGLGWRGVWVRTGTADTVSPQAAGPGGARRRVLPSSRPRGLRPGEVGGQGEME